MIITVVTPTLNGAEFLAECIDSVRRQESASVTVEHLIVDAGSTDGTLEIAVAHGIRTVTGKDSGIYDALNRGHRSAAGVLVGFLGADDILLDGALAAVADAYESTGRRWIAGGVRWIGMNGENLGRVSAPPSWMTASAQAALGWCCVHNMAAYIAANLFDELGGYDIAFKTEGDFDLYCRALLKEPFARINHPIAGYRRTGHNASFVQADLMYREIDQVRARYAPTSRLRRFAYRALMKSWLNATNPGWAIAKRIPGRQPTVLSSSVPRRTR